MKKILLLCFAVLLLCQATAFAHTMPKEEMYIGGVGFGCTLGYVKDIYGEPQEIIWKETGKSGTKMGITYYVTYKYSDAFKVIGRKHERDSSPEDEITVVSVILKDNSLSTPSGFTVGMPYAAIVEIFGEGQKYTHQGRTWYDYSGTRYLGALVMEVFVDSSDTITEIKVCSQH